MNTAEAEGQHLRGETAAWRPADRSLASERLGTSHKRRFLMSSV